MSTPFSEGPPFSSPPTQNPPTAPLIANAQAFAGAFFSALSGDRDSLYDFYHPDAALTWEHSQFSGSAAICAFLRSLPALDFDALRWTVTAQGIASSASALVVAAGPCAVGSSGCGFHSLFVLELDPARRSALIRTHAFRLL
jgi:hypothetical protein